MIISDDTGYGGFGPYGGGKNAGIVNPSIDRMDKEGMQFWTFYGQPSCTPGRAAMQTALHGRNVGKTVLTIG